MSTTEVQPAEETVDSGSTEVDYTRQGPRDLALIGEVWTKRGHVIRVNVSDAGHGPAVSVREFIEREAYTAERWADVGKPVRVGKGKAEHFVTLREPYTGPTKAGFWLSLEACEVLVDAMASALMEAGRIAEGDLR